MAHGGRALVDAVPDSVVAVLDRDLRVVAAGGRGLAGTPMATAELEGRPASADEQQ